eukprot:TRINITY_DN74424_c0_g1_i1.p1 TRINITY_DN74424_c0_g1~~TRINITY_DN74424_c0_g1_i1.p1  ORF type:complete len:251 (-),score=40.68 TRINITY_DN74424_c0_g1_i1:102-779(-)
MPKFLLPPALQPLAETPGGLTATLLGAMAAPHCLYAYIWQYPNDFKERSSRAPLALLGGDAVQVMSKLVLGLKAVQISSILAWCEYGLLPACGSGSEPGKGFAVVNALRSAAPARWILGLGLLVPGQILNIGIYRAIGNNGVYYGCKLGKPVPWASGFPFNIGLRHPQYVGAVLSWAGMFTLLAATPSTAAPLGAVLFGSICCYFATSCHEASSDADSNSMKRNR